MPSRQGNRESWPPISAEPYRRRDAGPAAEWAYPGNARRSYPHRMRRIASLLAVALLLAGCSLPFGPTDWNRIEITYDAGTTQPDQGDYTLVITPTQATFSRDPGNPQKLPEGVWPVITAGLQALGPRQGVPCPEGPSIRILAKNDDTVKQSFEASKCDSGDALAQAEAAVTKILEALKLNR